MNKVTITLALGLMLAAMPLMSAAVAVGGAQESCLRAYESLRVPFWDADEYARIPAPVVPQPDCRAFAPECDGALCVLREAGTYFVPGDLDLTQNFQLLGPANFALLVNGDLTVSGRVESVMPAGLVPGQVDGSSLILAARTIHIQATGVLRAADGVNGADVLARGAGATAFGVPGGNGGSIVLLAESVTLDGKLEPGDGGAGGDAVGIASAAAIAGDGGHGGIAQVLAHEGSRVLAGGNGGDGGAAFSTGGFRFKLAPCETTCVHAPSTGNDVSCFGGFCLLPFNVDTGPVGRTAKKLHEIPLPTVPQSPDEVTRALCAIVRDCTVPNPPPVGDPSQTVGGVVELVQQRVPPGPYCAAGKCFEPQDPTDIPDDIPDTGEVVQKVVGLIPPGPYCVPAWGFCLQRPTPPQDVDDVTGMIPTVPPPPKPTPCIALASCKFWEDVSDIGVRGIDGAPVSGECGAPARGADGSTGYNADGGNGGSATSSGCGGTDGPRGQDGSGLIVYFCNGTDGTDGGGAGPGNHAVGGDGGNSYNNEALTHAGNGGSATSKGGRGGNGGAGGNGANPYTCAGGNGGAGGKGGNGANAEGGHGGVTVNGIFWYDCAEGGNATSSVGSGGAGGAGGRGSPAGKTGTAGSPGDSAGTATHGDECPPYVL